MSIKPYANMGKHRWRNVRYRRLLLGTAETPTIFADDDDIGEFTATSITSPQDLTSPANAFVAGDGILVVVSNDDEGGTPQFVSISDDVDGTTGWTLVSEMGNSDADVHMAVWFKTATGGETTFSHATGFTGDTAALVIRVPQEDFGTLAVTGNSYTSSGNSTTHVITGVNAPIGSVQMLMFAAGDGGDTAPMTAEIEWTKQKEIETASNTTGATIAAWSRDVDAEAVEDNTVTMDSADGMSGIMLGFTGYTPTLPDIVFESGAYTTGTASNSTALTCSLPSGLTSGDLCLMIYVTNRNASDPTFSVSSTLLEGQGNATGTGNWTCHMHYFWASGGESTVDVNTGTVNTDTVWFYAYRISGVDTTTPFDDRASIEQKTTLITDTSDVDEVIWTSTPKAMAVKVFHSHANLAPTIPGAYTEEAIGSDDGRVTLAHEVLDVPGGSGGNTWSWTGGTDGHIGIFTFALRPLHP